MSDVPPSSPLWLFPEALTSWASNLLIRSMVYDDEAQAMSVELVRFENTRLSRRCTYRLPELPADDWTRLRDTLTAWQDEQRLLRIEIGTAAEVIGDPTTPTDVVTIPRTTSTSRPE